jgi:hypothetical protein
MWRGSGVERRGAERSGAEPVRRRGGAATWWRGGAVDRPSVERPKSPTHWQAILTISRSVALASTHRTATLCFIMLMSFSPSSSNSVGDSAIRRVSES